MGAVVNLRPELFRAVVAEVPFVDVVNTMLDETMPLTVGEYIEWGNPKLAEQYAWMRAYSPYDNLKPGAYPAMLVRTGLNDSQVAYWEPAKYVARLRTLKTDDRPLLLRSTSRSATAAPRAASTRCARSPRTRCSCSSSSAWLAPKKEPDQTSKNTVSFSPCRRMSKR